MTCEKGFLTITKRYFKVWWGLAWKREVVFHHGKVFLDHSKKQLPFPMLNPLKGYDPTS